MYSGANEHQIVFIFESSVETCICTLLWNGTGRRDWRKKVESTDPVAAPMCADLTAESFRLLGYSFRQAHQKRGTATNVRIGACNFCVRCFATTDRQPADRRTQCCLLISLKMASLTQSRSWYCSCPMRLRLLVDKRAAPILRRAQHM
jgi:hypothetical protein